MSDNNLPEHEHKCDDDSDAPSGGESIADDDLDDDLGPVESDDEPIGDATQAQSLDDELEFDPDDEQWQTLKLDMPV